MDFTQDRFKETNQKVWSVKDLERVSYSTNWPGFELRNYSTEPKGASFHAKAIFLFFFLRSIYVCTYIFPSNEHRDLFSFPFQWWIEKHRCLSIGDALKCKLTSAIRLSSGVSQLLYVTNEVLHPVTSNALVTEWATRATSEKGSIIARTT